MVRIIVKHFYSAGKERISTKAIRFFHQKFIFWAFYGQIDLKVLCALFQSFSHIHKCVHLWNCNVILYITTSHNPVTYVWSNWLPNSYTEVPMDKSAVRNFDLFLLFVRQPVKWPSCYDLQGSRKCVSNIAGNNTKQMKCLPQL